MKKKLVINDQEVIDSARKFFAYFELIRSNRLPIDWEESLKVIEEKTKLQLDTWLMVAEKYPEVMLSETQDYPASMQLSVFGNLIVTVPEEEG